MVTIRRIRPTEGQEFRAIRLQALADSPTAFGSTVAETESRPAKYWVARAAAGAAGEDSVLFVAEEADAWVGLVGGFVEGETERDVELISMWVNPSYRGRGVGRQLVEQLLEWASSRGAGRVLLWVTENNVEATSLYRRCGFIPSGDRQPHPSQPALWEQRMLRDLTPPKN